MAKKLGKKARKFARKNLQSAAKRNRKIRNQINYRRPRRGESPTLLPPARLAVPARGLNERACSSFFQVGAPPGRMEMWTFRRGSTMPPCNSSSSSLTMLCVTWLGDVVLCCNIRNWCAVVVLDKFTGCDFARVWMD